MRVMPLSFSRLSVFEQCEARFDYQYVSKRVQDSPNEASAYGDRVHKALEAYGRGTFDRATASIEDMQTINQWGGIVDLILGKPGTKLFEHQMSVNADLSPVGWFDKDVWIRAIADVLVVNGSTAYCFDYKTGKVKDNPTQLQVFAAMTMWHFPEVQSVRTSFIWLKANTVTNADYRRDKLEAMWDALSPRFTKVQDTINLGVFATKPSGLCPWCPANDICPDARKRRR